MSSPGNNPPHEPRVDPVRPQRQDAHDAKIEAEALAEKSGEGARPWYKRLFNRG
jgi:hypothetical protein